MKYFVNYPYTAESLKAEFRALCLTMHPDKGGNADEFKAMSAEYEQAARNLDGTRQHADAERARQEAEDRRREREEEERERREEEARRAKAREEEARREAERIRKAQEVSRAAVRAWAGILERVAADATGQKARFYRFSDKKEAAAFVATTKRNIKAVINHYFPGLKVSVSISGRIWKENFEISWQDGPSIKELRDTCKELRYFIPSYYEPAGPCDDYGQYHEAEGSAPWREAYGQALGDLDDFETVRTLSDEGKQEAEALAARILSGWDHVEGGRIRVTLSEFCNLREALGFERLNDRRMYWANYANNDRREDGEDVADMYRDALRRVIYENATITVTELEKAERRAAEFRPRYGEALRKLRDLTGVGSTDKDGDAVCFFTADRNDRRLCCRRLTIAEAVERLEQGEAVAFGTEHKGEDGRAWYWGKFAGGYKTQDKRAEKFAAAGLTIRGHVSPNSFVSLHGIAPQFAAAIRADLQDIERQRREWEQEQTAKASEQADNEPTAAKTDNTTSENREAATGDETAPAEGLDLVELADGLAVTGDSRTTYKHRRDIKAHGCTWNKTAQQWEAHSAEDCETLRRWFALREQTTATTQDEPTTDTTATATDTTTDEGEPEALRGATLQEIERKSDRTAAPAWLKPGATFKRTTSDGREVVAICTRLLLDGFAYITANGCAVVDHVAAFAGYNFDGLTPCDINDNAPEFAHMLRNFQRIRKGFEEYQTAHPYTEQADTLESGQDKAPESTERPDTTTDEGVTIPAATLARWKQEATEGTKTAAARLREVCACLASLTPDSRRDFDALGTIFWSLSEQIRNGYSPDTLQAATDYARAQLFDLIDRTQNANQARAVREANGESDEQRRAA